MGVVLLILVLVLISMQQKPPMNQPSVPLAQIKEIVESCIQESLTVAVQQIGAGDFLEDKEPTIFFAGAATPYLFPPARLRFVSTTDIQNKIEKIVDAELPTCISESQDIPGIELTVGQSQAALLPESIQTAVYVPIEVRWKTASQTIELWEAGISSNLFTLVQVANEIVSLHEHNPDDECLSCYADLGERLNVSVELIPSKPDTIIYLLTSTNSEESFVFAGRFEIKEPEQPLAELSLASVPTQRAAVGKSFSLDVKANAPVLFSDYSPLFEVDPIDGVIRFTPTEDMVGPHTILIEAESQDGRKAFTRFLLEVVK